MKCPAAVSRRFARLRAGGDNQSSDRQLALTIRSAERRAVGACLPWKARPARSSSAPGQARDPRLPLPATFAQSASGPLPRASHPPACARGLHHVSLVAEFSQLARSEQPRHTAAQHQRARARGETRLRPLPRSTLRARPPAAAAPMQCASRLGASACTNSAVDPRPTSVTAAAAIAARQPGTEVRAHCLRRQQHASGDARSIAALIAASSHARATRTTSCQLRMISAIAGRSSRLSSGSHESRNTPMRGGSSGARRRAGTRRRSGTRPCASPCPQRRSRGGHRLGRGRRNILGLAEGAGHKHAGA